MPLLLVCPSALARNAFAEQLPVMLDKKIRCVLREKFLGLITFISSV